MADLLDQPFPSGRAAAKALLEAGLKGTTKLTHRSGQFLGGVAFSDADSLSERQADWLGKLLSRANLPPLAEGGAA